MLITRINDFHARADKARALREFLQSIIALVEDAPGCQSVALMVHHEDPARFVIVEVWESIEAHQASVSRIPPGKIEEVQPLLVEPPKGAYYDRIQRPAYMGRRRGR